jgi:hypothetical protein
MLLSAGSGLLNIHESENHWFQVSESKHCQFLLFQKLVFIKELAVLGMI